MPLIFLAASVFLLGTYMISEPLIFSADILVIASGIPVYFLWIKRPRR